MKWSWLVVAVLGMAVMRAWPKEHAARNPFSADAASLGAGKALYAKHCASCHGAAGHGDGPGAGGLPRKPADFSDPAIRSASDESLFDAITGGRKPMPSFDQRLTEEERWHLVNYLRSLSAGNP
jgi:mono/diheme cytochrome c family protein